MTYSELCEVVREVHLLSVQLHDQVPPLLGPPQDVDLVPCPQQGGAGLWVHAAHLAPLGEPNLVVAHNGVVSDGVGEFPVLGEGVGLGCLLAVGRERTY